MHILILLFVCMFCVSAFDGRCFFAKDYTVDRLLKNESSLDMFISDVLTWDGRFHTAGVGYNAMSGLSYDGCNLDDITGECRVVHNWSAASKESLHLNMLTLVLMQVKNVEYWAGGMDDQDVYEILERKMDSYERFLESHPGFGGFLPWFYVSDDGLIPTPSFSNSVPGLDNGQLSWSLLAITKVLEKKNRPLAERYQKYTEMLMRNSVIMFYNDDGYVRALTEIINISGKVEKSNFKNGVAGYFLDDPYEGELMVFWMDLFGSWSNESDKDLIWVNKRKKLVGVNYPSSKGPITVQKGWWFSSHEQWKFLVLPYRSIDICNRVFLNGERARTINSNEFLIPGLYASVTAPDLKSYISATGIGSIAFEQIQSKDTVTPYGAFPVILADKVAGMVWYYNMINIPQMQGMLGSSESSYTNGTEVGKLVTWDSKITTDLAILGGITDLTKEILLEGNHWKRFSTVVNREYTMAFPSLLGEKNSFSIPSATIKSTNPPFSKC